MKRKHDSIVEEIHKVRKKLYEEQKHLTVEERIKQSNELARKYAKEYGFKVVGAIDINHRNVV